MSAFFSCPACGKEKVHKLYACRHCQERVCFSCVFVKRCCGKVAPGHKRHPRLVPLREAGKK